MDCKTARLFLPFYRPGATDLSGPEVKELEDHVALCSECNALASAQRRLDQHFGRAMRAIEVPPGLRQNVIEALAAQRRAWNRRWLGGAGGLVAAAGLLLAVSLSLYFLYSSKSIAISPDEVSYALNVTSRDQDRANEVLRRLGQDAVAPSFVNYAYMTGSPAVAELPGHKGVKVPQFIFTGVNARGIASRAIIYALEHRRFSIGEVDTPASGQFSVEVYQHSERDRVSYLVLYTDGSWKDWLMKERESVE
jgi:hypothetical protein